MLDININICSNCGRSNGKGMQEVSPHHPPLKETPQSIMKALLNTGALRWTLRARQIAFVAELKWILDGVQIANWWLNKCSGKERSVN